jgi:zinc/manganese transport system ATP-binding protein
MGRRSVGAQLMTAMPAITLENLTVTYDRHPAVHHIDGCFDTGSLTAIVGPNGAGKSTLLKAIMGLLDPAEGRIRCHATDRRRDLAYLPQQAAIDRSFPINVADTVAAGAWHDIGAFGGIRPGTKRLIGEALQAVGLEGFERRPVGSLSAGQFQRVLFARLLLQSAPIILLDEPFTAIDARTTSHLLELVRHWHGAGKTVVAVLHDGEQVRRYFPRTLLLAREPIGWGPTEDVLTPANLLAMRRMSERWDDDAGLCRRNAS